MADSILGNETEYAILFHQKQRKTAIGKRSLACRHSTFVCFAAAGKVDIALNDVGIFLSMCARRAGCVKTFTGKRRKIF
jgi:hypothetical protein